MPVIYSPLSDSELDSVCLSLVNKDLPYFSAFHEAFVLLYLTGCRVTELFQITSWERVSGYEMRFLPHKGNYHRNVTLDSRCDSFIDAVVGQFKPFGGLSSGQLNSVFYNFSEYSNFRVGTKPVSLYLFRYNFIRRLFNNGLNINQIADEMGYTSTTVVGGYLTAAIDKGFFLDTSDFVKIGNLFWSQKNLQWSDGGADIVVLDSFGTGEMCYYYKYSAIQRYLSVFPSFRLPSASDFTETNTFLLNSGLGGLRSLMIPSLVYWSFLNSVLKNTFEMRLIGAGRIYYGSLNGVKDYAYFLLSDSTDSMPWSARLVPSNTSFSKESSNRFAFFSVRLILTV